MLSANTIVRLASVAGVFGGTTAVDASFRLFNALNHYKYTLYVESKYVALHLFEGKVMR